MDIIVHKPEEVTWNQNPRNPLYLFHIFKYGNVLYEKSSKDAKT